MPMILSELGAGVMLAWLALPILALPVLRDERAHPASRFRALLLVMVLADGVLAAPLIRAVARTGTKLDLLPASIEHHLAIAWQPIVSTRWGDLSALGLLAIAWAVFAAAALVRCVFGAVAVARVVRRCEEAPAHVV